MWRRVDHAAYVDSGDRVVDLDLDHLDLPPYIFEGSAAAVWACFDGDLTEAETVSELAEAYQVEPAVVAVDVRQFVDRLRTLGLVVAGS